jgi:homospermidine synthase
MKKGGVKGVHIAERDTQRLKLPKPLNVFWNTWSVEGFISEGLQPAELGWGTHENWKPKNAKKHKKGCKAAIYLEQPGANTRVRTWCPTPGPQYGFLVTHNESISIADYFTVRNKDGDVTYRPTCHYAYHPANDAVLSLHEMFGNGGKRSQSCMCLTKTSWSTVSMSSAFCSMAMARTPTGTAHGFHWKKPAASRPTRTPLVCR